VNSARVVIKVALVRLLVETQFPRWAQLPVRPVTPGGWDNRTFHLGDDMVIRMPRAVEYAAAVAKEQRWLPKLASRLPVAIPTPLALGQPGCGYPWQWSIYGWLEGKTAALERITDLRGFASELGQFLVALRGIDSSGGPQPGPENFHRGGTLSVYDAETWQAISALERQIDAAAVARVWEAALSTTWRAPPVWVHGDITANNLLVRNGHLGAVIDFGQLAVGDPACDLSIAWTLFHGQSREMFRRMISLDTGTWARARGWALWKALIVAAGLTDTNATEATQPWRIIDDVIAADIAT
jgi:aminoglycoside phosphotransferase (APT) family kinase protein